jgi:hypothetical protein
MNAALIGDPVPGTCYCPCPGPCVYPDVGVIIKGSPVLYSTGRMVAQVGDIVMFSCGTANIVGPGALTFMSSGIPLSTTGDNVTGGSGCGIVATVAGSSSIFTA